MGDKTRKFVIDGKELYFAKDKFKIHFKTHQTANNLQTNILKRLIADHVSVSESTVNGWLCGPSGPATTDIIAGLADFFNLPESDFYVEEEQPKMEKLNEQQIQAVDRIYKEIINFLFLFLNTGGVFSESEYIYNFHVPYDKRHEYAGSEFEKVKIAWYKEFVYLKGTQIYDELDEYIWNDLIGTYQDISGNIPEVDKCSYQYRSPGGTVWKDYDAAMVKLQELISKYI